MNKLLVFLLKLNNLYLKANQALVYIWRKCLGNKSQNGFIIALRKLIEDPATALFLNTVLFMIIGSIFGGTIELIFFLLVAINIVLFCLNIIFRKP